MRGLVAATVVALSVLSGGARPLWAQSLGDLAQQEAERRKTIKSATKVYTNKDLGNAQPPPAPPAAAGQSAPAGAASTAPGAQAGSTGQTGSTGQVSSAGATSPTGQTAAVADKDKGAPKDQAYWAGRMKDLNTQLARDQTYASALQTQVNSLTADFINRDDPAQRSVIEQNRQQALSEFARLTKDVEKDRKAIADLEEEARRAGVPPGWLR
jgi:hypothetical protein